MTINEYAKLVNEMRTAQKDFFRTRSESALETPTDKNDKFTACGDE